MPPGVDSAAVAAAEAAVPAAPAEGPGDAQEEQEALRQKTLKLFGTDDLTEILSMGGASQVPIAGGETFGQISSDVSNFEAILMAHGVNPQDIEGPLVHAMIQYNKL